MSDPTRVYPRSADGRSNNGSIARDALTGPEATPARVLVDGRPLPKVPDGPAVRRAEVSAAIAEVNTVLDAFDSAHGMLADTGGVHDVLIRARGRLEAIRDHVDVLPAQVVYDEIGRARTAVMSAEWTMRALGRAG